MSRPVDAAVGGVAVRGRQQNVHHGPIGRAEVDESQQRRAVPRLEQLNGAGGVVFAAVQPSGGDEAGRCVADGRYGRRLVDRVVDEQLLRLEPPQDERDN